jgi:hypothetical protein
VRAYGESFPGGCLLGAPTRGLRSGLEEECLEAISRGEQQAPEHCTTGQHVRRKVLTGRDSMLRALAGKKGCFRSRLSLALARTRHGVPAPLVLPRLDAKHGENNARSLYVPTLC